MAGILGGPTEGDASETVFSTWSIAHGNLACAYPHLGTYHFGNLVNPFAQTAPLYPLVTGAVSAVLRIGHDVAFPSGSQLGPNCTNAIAAMFHWSANSAAILPTVRLSYVTWPILLVGIVAVLRASGRGRCGWEPLALLMAACTPTVLMCITFFFHPEDVLALGLILIGVALVIKGRWTGVGVLIGLACCAQQFAFLAAAPLLVIAPTRHRIRYIGGALFTIVIIDVPLVVATSGRALRTIILGSSRVGIINRSTGGTVLWETDIHGVLLFLVSRVAPIIAAMVLAWWASKRLGAHLLSPVPIASLLSATFVFRLVFEENLFGYYFMAVSVTFVVLEVVRGRFRGTVLAWIALVTVAFNPIHAGFFSNLTGHTLDLYYAVPIVVYGAVAATVIVDAVFRRVRVYKLAWLLLAGFTCETRLWGVYNPVFNVPNWLWQVILVPIALALALQPLLTAIAGQRAADVAVASEVAALG